MWVMHDLVMMFINLFVSFLIGLLVLLVILIITFLLRNQIKEFFLVIWSLLHKPSYLDYLQREEAVRDLKEDAE